MNFDSAPGQDNSGPEKINDKEKIDFMQAQNFPDLYKSIILQGEIKSDNETYMPNDIIEIIEKVRKGDLTLNFITRTNDLRLAVKKILETSGE